MRIVGGRLRGARLAEVGAGDEAARLRPTSDRTREAVFNLIAHGGYGGPPPPPAGLRALDLFAGTGALGLEALSRGAVEATFVETGRAALGLLRANVAKLRLGGAARLVERDATRLGPNPGAPYDLVFLDPPYGQGLGERAVAAALAGGWLAPGALVVWEEGSPIVPPPGLTPRDARRYGNAMISLLTVASR
jgi:16S rRNA (guanine966-N2)-methyltransferase